VQKEDQQSAATSKFHYQEKNKN